MKQQQKGILLIIASAFFFSLMSLFVKLSGDLPSIQKSFFRNFVAMLFATLLLIRSGKGFSFQRRNLPFLLIRSLFGTLGILCNFYAVDHLCCPTPSISWWQDGMYRKRNRKKKPERFCLKPC